MKIKILERPLPECYQGRSFPLNATMAKMNIANMTANVKLFHGTTDAPPFQEMSRPMRRSMSDGRKLCRTIAEKVRTLSGPAQRVRAYPIRRAVLLPPSGNRFAACSSPAQHAGRRDKKANRETGGVARGLFKGLRGGEDMPKGPKLPRAHQPIPLQTSRWQGPVTYYDELGKRHEQNQSFATEREANAWSREWEQWLVQHLDQRGES